MIYPLSQKSLDCIAFNGFFLVLEGAIRSTKTVTANVAFYKRVLQSRDSVFIISGYTQQSVIRNVIEGDFGLLALTRRRAKIKEDRDHNKYLLLPVPVGDPRKEIRIYYFGADNVRSYKKIRGMTIGGWLADEYDLHDWDFIENAEGRSITAQDRFQIATLNPNVPGHRIYRERIDKYMNMPGYKYQHFTIDDNPAITPERKAELAQQYTGVFYDRYILGLRVRAEGSCYPAFSEKNILFEVPENIRSVVIGVDVGGNKSASTFAATGYYLKDKKMHAVLLDELHDADNKDAETFVKNFVLFAKRVTAKYKCADCYFESGEQLLKNSCEATGLLNVYNSVKKPIIDRIRFADLMYSRGQLNIMHYCNYTIDAVRSAVFDPKSDGEERLDNGTVDIDSIDAFEYSFTNYMGDFD